MAEGSPERPLVVSTETKREAYQLCSAIEMLVYYDERTITAGLIALAAAFHGLVEEAKAGSTMGCFKAVLMAILSGPGLPKDDPALRGYVFQPHETVQ